MPTAITRPPRALVALTCAVVGRRHLERLGVHGERFQIVDVDLETAHAGVQGEGCDGDAAGSQGGQDPAAEGASRRGHLRRTGGVGKDRLVALERLVVLQVGVANSAPRGCAWPRRYRRQNSRTRGARDRRGGPPDAPPPRPPRRALPAPAAAGLGRRGSSAVRLATGSGRSAWRGSGGTVQTPLQPAGWRAAWRCD